MLSSMSPIAVLLVLGLGWIMLSPFRNVMETARAYPVTRSQPSTHCGLYICRPAGRLLGVYVQVAVNSNGLLMSWPVIPFIYSIQAFVPWGDVWLRDYDDKAHLEFSRDHAVGFTFNRVVLSAMQHSLGRAVPFGHVV